MPRLKIQKAVTDQIGHMSRKARKICRFIDMENEIERTRRERPVSQGLISGCTPTPQVLMHGEIPVAYNYHGGLHYLNFE